MIAPITAKALHLDLETRAAVDLKRRGLFNYAPHKHTDLLCACYAFDKEPVQLWIPGQPVPKRVIKHIEDGRDVWAHNATFERELIYHHGHKHGWPQITAGQSVCTMALCYSTGLHGSLEKAALTLGLSAQKDAKGKRIMLQLCMPEGEDAYGEPVFWTPEERPEMFAQLYDYCRQDVEVEREIGRRVLALPKFERRVYAIDQAINTRGIRVDVPAAAAAIKVVEMEDDRLDAEMKLITNRAVSNCSRLQDLARWLEWQGVFVDNLAKADLAELLEREDLPAVARQALGLRKEYAKSSTSKLYKMVELAGDDGRVRGAFQYHGAATGRWAGRGVQLQNLPRAKISPERQEKILSALPELKAPADFRRLLEPGETCKELLSKCLRGFLIPGPGKKFVVMDFSSIEPRVLALLAGETWVLEVFRKGLDLYVEQAARVPMAARAEDPRQFGKIMVLLLGYLGGVVALQKGARIHGIKLSKEDAEELKEGYRGSNQNIVQFAYDLERAAKAAVKHRGRTFYAGKYISFLFKGPFLFCRLPSGRCICYPYPKLMWLKTPWGTEKETLTYMAVKGEKHHQAVHEDEEVDGKKQPVGKWTRIKTYSGKLSENVTQAVARDGLAVALDRLETEYATDEPTVGHSHDEGIFEFDEGVDPQDYIEAVMSQPPEWAPDLPMAAEGWTGSRYRK